MSLRLIQPGLSALAGKVIGYRKDGRPIYLAAGGAPESGDDTPPDAEGGDDDSGDESDDEDDEDEEDDTSAKDKKSKDDEEETVPKWKYDKTHKRMTAADQRAAGLQKQLDELKANADVPAEVKRELEQVKQQVAAKDEQISKVTGERDRLSVKLAALTIKNGPDWEDVDAALKLADLSEVDVDDETGRVDTRALKSVLTALAKEKPYLVKKTRTADTTQTTQTASTMNGQRKGRKGNAPDVEVLKSRFPALRQQ